MFFKLGVLESLYDKVAGLMTCIFIKKRLYRMCFPVNIAKLLRTAFFIEHLWGLLLSFQETNFQNYDNIT